MATTKSTTSTKSKRNTSVDEKELFKPITFLEPIWKNIPTGSKFKATIRGHTCSGMIMEENNKIYLLQNVISGTECENKLNYKFSYSINEGKLSDLRSQGVVFKEITLNPGFVVLETIFLANRPVKFNKGSISVGCVKISNKLVRKIIDRLID